MSSSVVTRESVITRGVRCLEPTAERVQGLGELCFEQRSAGTLVTAD